MSITLNSEQMAAVSAPDGPSLVLAGAGSGKTRVIVERIRWLIEQHGIDPRNILALTFTNKAAREIRSRVARALDVERLASWMGTFHGFGLFVLRREMERLGRSKEFTVFDDADQLMLMRRLIKELPKELVQVSPREALTWISRHKQELEEPGAAEEGAEARSYRELWARYHAALDASSAVDFDDLLAIPVRLFEQFPDVADKYRRRFPHILVDEYQDTNRAQYLMLRHLASETGSLFVVGDEDQAIYSWRGADIRNILEFEKDFPNARIYRLEQNYRSTRPILDAANAMIAANTERIGKTLRTDRGAGPVVQFALLEDGKAEAEWVFDAIKVNRYPYDRTAILFRTNAQARAIEEVLLRKSIPYQTVGVVRFYARREIKDLIAYLRLLANPADDEALRRIVNVPQRGIGDKTFEQIEQTATAAGEPLLSAMRGLGSAAGQDRIGKACSDFVSLVDRLSDSRESGGVADLVVRVVEQTHYREWLEQSDASDYRDRIDNVEEFIQSCREHDESSSGGLQGFLQDLAISSEVDRWSEAMPAVTLMTCHSAKGLEFDHVFLIGLEEGFLPHGASMDEVSSVEEERRVCYVAMTRARESLHLSAAKSRSLFGETKPRHVSRFLEAIPASLLAHQGVGSAGPASTGGARRVDSTALKTGTRVRHKTFGTGRVMYTSGTGDNVKVTIRFDRGRSRQFLVRATPLEIM